MPGIRVELTARLPSRSPNSKKRVQYQLLSSCAGELGPAAEAMGRHVIEAADGQEGSPGRLRRKGWALAVDIKGRPPASIMSWRRFMAVLALAPSH